MKEISVKQRKAMRPASFLSICMLLITLSGQALAMQKTFVRDYTYEASELDDKVSCQSIALEQVKRLMLEELGTYVESISIVKDHQLDHDEITTLTAGIVRTKILQELWDGKRYWLKAKLSADTDEVAEAIAQLKDNRQLINDLQEARQEASDAMAEVVRLKAALAGAEVNPEQKSRYGESIRRLQATDLLERGQSYIVAGNYEEAVDAYNQAVAMVPGDAKGYSHLATAYIFLGNYQRAFTNLNRAVRLNPGNHYLAQRRDITNKMLTSSHPITTQEKKFLARPEVVRVHHAYLAPSQTPVLSHHPPNGMKPERANASTQPQQGGQGNIKPVMRQDHRHQELRKPQAQTGGTVPAAIQQDHRHQAIQRQARASDKLPSATPQDHRQGVSQPAQASAKLTSSTTGTKSAHTVYIRQRKL